MADISQQITQQRSQVEQARQQLQAQRKKQQEISQAKLRGIERGTRQQKSALTQRAERKAAAEMTEKSLGEVSQFETSFEQEVASKVPQYGKQEFVDVEYQKATKKIQDEISNIQSQIEQKQKQKQEYLSRNQGDRADEVDEDIDVLEARIRGYGKALSGDKATVIQNVNTGYAERLADYEALRKQEKQQFKQSVMNIQPLVVESMSSASKQPVQDFTYQNILTGEKVSAITAPSKLYVKTTPFTVELTKTELPKSSISKPSISGNIVLNNVNLPSMNELDVSTRKGGGFVGNVLGRVSNFIGGRDDFKKGYQREIYDPRKNTFVSASPTGAGSTAYLRPPTLEEQKELDKGNKVEEFFGKVKSAEAGIVPPLALSRTVYLPDKPSLEKYGELLEGSKFTTLSGWTGVGGYRLSEFTKEQEKRLQQDLEYARAYNKIVEETGRQPREFTYGDKKIDVEKLFERLKVGSMGSSVYPTGWDVVRKSADIYKKGGQDVNILGLDVSPDVARGALKAGVSAYQVEKVVLAFQLGGVGAAALGFTPTLTGGATALKVLKGTQVASTALLAPSLGTYSAVKEYKTSGDLSYAIGAGVGTTAGFLGSVYSKEIVESTIKAPKFLGDLGSREIKGIIGKKGSIQVSQYQGEVVEVIYKGQRVKMTLADAKRLGLTPLVSREAVISDLQFYPKSKQIEFVKLAFQKDPFGNTKIYLDQKSLDADIIKATKFLKEAGLSNQRVKEILTTVFPERFTVTTPVKSTRGGLLFDDAAEQTGIISTSQVSVPTPKMVGGTGAESLFAGTGQYEQSSFITGQTIKTSQPLITLTTTIQSDKSNQILNTKQLSLLRTDERQKDKLKSLQIGLLKQPQRSKLEQPQKYEQKQISLLKFKQPQPQKQVTQQVTRQLLKQPQQTKQVEKVEIIPKEPTPIKLELGKALKQAKKAIKEDESLFEIFATKEGKDVLIGKAGTQQEAETLLKGTLTKTLRAGGFITKGGTKLKARELKTFGTGEFRLSKASPFKVIEKRSKRLRKSTTGKQIQAFRKPRRKKSSSLLTL